MVTHLKNSTIKFKLHPMIQALACLSGSVKYCHGSKLTPCNFNLSLQRNSKQEKLSSKQAKHKNFQITREYESVRRVVVNVGNRDDEMGDRSEGDERTRELLAEIALLEAQKVRVVEFMKEKSEYLKEMAEQTSSELQQITDESMKGMDEAGLKVLENVEAEVQACEEELASERAKMQIKDKQIDRFEKQTWQGRNEGLFFQALFSPAKKQKDVPPDKRNVIQMEPEMLMNVTKRTLNSSIRRNLYIFLILVLSLALIDVIASGNVEWPKLALYAVLLVIIVAQLTYEMIFSSMD